MKAQRIFLHSYRSSVNLPDESAKLDVYFSSKDRDYYIWTPTWGKGTRELFSEANRILGITKPEKVSTKVSEKTAEDVSEEEEKETSTVDYKFLARQLGKALGRKVSYQKVAKIAKDLFNFECKLHPDSGMVYMNSQNIYDWVISLSEQPISNQRKMRLLRQFISVLAPEDSPLATLKEGDQQSTEA